VQRSRHSFAKSLAIAAGGVVQLLRSQRNARIHLVFAVAVAGAAVLLRVTVSEWIALVACIGGVFAAEAMNTAVETVVDLVQPEPHPLAGRAKDYAAAAVLVAASAAAIVGALIFGPKIILWFS
jgi:diacylglycerol kinase